MFFKSLYCLSLLKSCKSFSNAVKTFYLFVFLKNNSQDSIPNGDKYCYYVLCIPCI